MLHATLTSSQPQSARTAELWQAIEWSVREACVLRAEGREPEAIVILQQKLPQLIGPWSRGAGLATEKCQQLLREMIARVQQQVATAAICKRMVLQTVAPAPGRRGGPSESVHVHRRVPLADIPGMLDALDEGERAASFRRQNFPSSVLRLAAVAGRD